MIVKLLTEHHLEILSFKEGFRGSSESTHIKMPHCTKSHARLKLLFRSILLKGCRIPYTMPLQVYLKISLLLPKWKKESVLHEA